MANKASGKKAAKTEKEDATDEGMDEDDDWFATGYDEVDNLDEASRARMKDGEERVYMFVDGDGKKDCETFGRKVGAPFCINEFEFATERPDGDVDFYNYLTSTKARMSKRTGKPLPNYPLEFQPKMRDYYIGFYTVLDITAAWDSDDGKGKVYMNLLPVKRKVLKILRRHSSRKKGLRGCVFIAIRDTKQDARIGNQWDFQEKLEEDQIQEFLKMGKFKDEPFDYLKILAVKSREEVETILTNYVPPTPFGEKKKKGRGRGRDDNRDDNRDDDRGRGRRYDQEDDYDDRSRRSRSRGRDRDDRDDDRDRDRDEPRGRSRSRSRDDDDRDQDRDREERPRRRSRSHSDDEDNDNNEKESRPVRRGRRSKAKEEEPADEGSPFDENEGSNDAPDEEPVAASSGDADEEISY